MNIFEFFGYGFVVLLLILIGVLVAALIVAGTYLVVQEEMRDERDHNPGGNRNPSR